MRGAKNTDVNKIFNLDKSEQLKFNMNNMTLTAE
jgi:hypothetical protein